MCLQYIRKLYCDAKRERVREKKQDRSGGSNTNTTVGRALIVYDASVSWPVESPQTICTHRKIERRGGNTEITRRVFNCSDMHLPACLSPRKSANVVGCVALCVTAGRRGGLRVKSIRSNRSALCRVHLKECGKNLQT